MTEAAGQNPQNPQTQQVQVQVKEDKMQTLYSNMVRLFSGPQAEELILDFGTMTPSTEKPEAMQLEVNARVVMNVYAAKRLALQLSQAVQRFEQQFGPVELDLRRRMKQQ